MGETFQFNSIPPRLGPGCSWRAANRTIVHMNHKCMCIPQPMITMTTRQQHRVTIRNRTCYMCHCNIFYSLYYKKVKEVFTLFIVAEYLNSKAFSLVASNTRSVVKSYPLSTILLMSDFNLNIFMRIHP